MYLSAAASAASRRRSSTTSILSKLRRRKVRRSRREEFLFRIHSTASLLESSLGDSQQHKPNSDVHGGHDQNYDKSRRKFPHLFPFWARRLCEIVVNDKRFAAFTILMICISSSMMGFATYDIVAKNPQVSHSFEVTERVFLSIFTVELLLHFIHKDFRIFFDWWLAFDFIVISLSWSFQATTQILRSFRIFRALRLVGRVETLRMLVEAILSSLPRILTIALLAILLLFIFGVLFTQLFRVDFETYFGRLDVSVFTLFQVMCLDSWTPIAWQVINEKPWGWLPFVSFIVASNFVVANLIIAVICDAVIVLQDLGEEQKDPTKQEIKWYEMEENKEQAKKAEKNNKIKPVPTNSKIHATPHENKEVPSPLHERVWDVTEEVESLAKQLEELVTMHNQARQGLDHLILQMHWTYPEDSDLLGE